MMGKQTLILHPPLLSLYILCPFLSAHPMPQSKPTTPLSNGFFFVIPPPDFRQQLATYTLYTIGYHRMGKENKNLRKGNR